MTTVFTRPFAPRVHPPGVHLAGLTRDLLAVALGLFATGALAMQKGLEMNQTWPARHRGDLLYLAGAVMLVVCMVTVVRRFGSQIRLGRHDLTHRTWAGTVSIAWRDMDIFEVGPHHGFPRRLRMGDARRTVTIDSLGYRDLDEIVRIATLLRQRDRADA